MRVGEGEAVADSTVVELINADRGGGGLSPKLCTRTQSKLCVVNFYYFHHEKKKYIFYQSAIYDTDRFCTRPDTFAHLNPPLCWSDFKCKLTTTSCRLRF